MQQYCGQCGQFNEDQSRFCRFCGARREPEPVQPPIWNAGPPVVQIPDGPEPPPRVVVVKEPVIKKRGCGCGCLTALVLVILLVVVGIFLYGRYGWVIALDTGVEVYHRGNTNRIRATAPDSVWDRRAELSGMDEDAVVEYYEAQAESRHDRIERRFGDNCRITYDIKDSETLSDREIELLEAALELRYLEEFHIQKGVEVELEYEIQGDEEDYEEEDESIFVMLDGVWYEWSLLIN